jgi:chromosome segregation ATPase
MIVELSSQVGELLAEAGRLEQQQHEVKNIQATRDTLNEVQQKIHSLKMHYQIISPRMADQKIAYIQQQAATIASAIETSRSNFATQRRQEKALKQTEKEVQKILQEIDAYWKHYSTEQIKPHTDMLELVRALPEIASQEATINELVAQLRKLSTASPASHNKITEFDNTLQQLKQRLATLQGLSPQIQDFLRKVQDGRATLHDLTDEVLSWCRQGEHASAFALSFRGRKG